MPIETVPGRLTLGDVSAETKDAKVWISSKSHIFKVKTITLNMARDAGKSSFNTLELSAEAATVLCAHLMKHLTDPVRKKVAMQQRPKVITPPRISKNGMSPKSE